MKLSLSFLVAPFLTGLLANNSYSGNRLLVLTDEGVSITEYSKFLSLLEGRGYSVDVKKAGDKEVEFSRFDELLYDHLVLFSPEAKTYGDKLKEKDVLDFVNQGGNVLMAANPKLSDFYKKVGSQFGITFDEKNSRVLDPFHHNVSSTDSTWDQIVTQNFASEAPFFSPKTRQDSPILFQGIAHSAFSIPQLTTILKPSSSSYSSLPSSFGTPGLYGSEIALVSAHQSLNNARFVVTGSLEMFSDKFLDSPIHESAVSGNILYPTSGNANLIEDLVKWTFQETSIVKVSGVGHHKVGETERPSHYRIKDEIIYTLNLTEYRDGKWIAFEADDVQLEIIMLDPYIRANLPFSKASVDSQGRAIGVYQLQLTLPDVYGVFTFRVSYRRDGLGGFVEADPIPIHPFRHNEFPRFLTPAYPYYTSMASMSVGFLLFSAIWLYNQDSGALSKNKKV